MKTIRFYIRVSIFSIGLILFSISMQSQTFSQYFPEDMSPWIRDWYKGLDERIEELEKIHKINTVINTYKRRSNYDFASTSTPNLYGTNNGSFNGISYYTGTYTHSIQLTDGVSINYTNNGIRVDQIAQMVGLGWNLSAGGKITRNVKGYPDDLLNWIYIGNDEYEFSGWLNDDPTLVSTFDPGDDDETRCNDLEYFIGNKKVGSKYYKHDSEPDVFSYDYHGVQGSFVFGNDKEIKNTQYTDLKISYEKDNYQIIKIIIEDRNGNTFIFGDDLGENIEKVKTNAGVYPDPSKQQYYDETFPTFQSGAFSNITDYISEYNQTWFLTKIILPDKSEVIFEYDDEYVNLETSFYESYRNHTSSNQGDYVSMMVRNFQFYPSNPVDLIAKTKRLKKFYSDIFEVEFIANNEREDLCTEGIAETKLPRSLDKIRVYSKLDGVKILEKQVDFYYSYFDSKYFPSNETLDNNGYKVYYIYDNPYGEYIYKRLKLDSISVYNGNQLLPPYKFQYGTDDHGEYWLPARYSYCQDIYGYYKKQNYSESLIPIVHVYPNKLGINRFSVYPLNTNIGENSEHYELYGVDRLPDDSYDLQDIGLLNRIEYPNGSYTEIEYGLNEFELEGKTLMGPGLRVESITYGGSDIHNMTKYYSYDSARLITMPHFGHFDPINTDETVCSNYFYNSNYSTWIKADFNEYYVRGTVNENDMSEGIMGYGRVEVTQSDIEGSTVYNFLNEATYGNYDLDNISYPHYEEAAAFTTPSKVDIEMLPQYNTVDVVPYKTGSDVGLNFTESSYPFHTNTNYSWYRGKLMSKEVYNSSNVLIMRDTNAYDFFYVNSGTEPEIVYGLKNSFLRNNLPPTGGNCSNSASDYDYLVEPLTVSTKYEIHTGKDSYLSSNYKSYMPEENHVIDETTSYNHNKYGLISKECYTDASDNKITTEYLYICDLWDLSVSIPGISEIFGGTTIAFFNAISNNRYSLPVQSISYKEVPNDNNKYLVGASIYIYKSIPVTTSSTLEVIDSIYTLKTPGITMINFDNSEISYQNGKYKFLYDKSFFEFQVNITQNTIKGEPIEIIENKGVSSARIYAVNNSTPVFESVNALASEVAYQGFEDHEDQSWSSTTGCSIEQNDAKSGEKYLKINPYNSTSLNKIINYDVTSQGYKASVWVKGAGIAKITMSINGGSITKSWQSVQSSEWRSLSIFLTRNELANLTGQSISVNLEVANISSDYLNIDDIVFVPDDAYYKGSVYDKKLRTIAEFDVNGNYINYEYDDFNRLLIVRDNDNYILTTNEYFTGHPCDFVYYPDDEITAVIKEDIPIRFVSNVKKASNIQFKFIENSSTSTSNVDINGYATHVFYNHGEFTVELSMEIDGVSYSKVRTIVVQQY